MIEKGQVIQWDAREEWTKELAKRGSLFLDVDLVKNPKEAYERLNDFENWASCAISNVHQDILEFIESLLYKTKASQKDIDNARKLMRLVFRDIQKELQENRIWIPTKEKVNLSKAINKTR